MIEFKEKIFSIESGNFEGTKRIPKKGKEVLHKLLSGVDAGFGLEGFLSSGDEVYKSSNFWDKIQDFNSWIKATAENSLFNSGRKKKFNSFDIISALRGKVDINKNPKDYVVSTYSFGNSLILFINKPKKKELSKLNDILSNYCFEHKDTDYASERVDKNTYVVDVYVPKDASIDLISDIIDDDFKVNIITGSKFISKGRQVYD